MELQHLWGWGLSICAARARRNRLRNYRKCIASKSSALPGMKIWATLGDKEPRPDKVLVLAETMNKLHSQGGEVAL